MTADQAANYGSLLGVFLVALYTRWSGRSAKRTATEVKDTLAKSTAENLERLGQIHNLVNGDRLLLLERVASLSRRLAMLSDNAHDRAEAARADDIYQKELMIRRENLKKEVNIETDFVTKPPTPPIP